MSAALGIARASSALHSFARDLPSDHRTMDQSEIDFSHADLADRFI